MVWVPLLTSFTSTATSGTPPDTPFGKGLPGGSHWSSVSQQWPGTLCQLKGARPEWSAPFPSPQMLSQSQVYQYQNRHSACGEAAETGLGQEAPEDSSHRAPMQSPIQQPTGKEKTPHPRPSCGRWKKGQMGTSGEDTVLVTFNSVNFTPW